MQTLRTEMYFEFVFRVERFDEKLQSCKEIFHSQIFFAVCLNKSSYALTYTFSHLGNAQYYNAVKT